MTASSWGPHAWERGHLAPRGCVWRAGSPHSQETALSCVTSLTDCYLGGDGIGKLKSVSILNPSCHLWNAIGPLPPPWGRARERGLPDAAVGRRNPSGRPKRAIGPPHLCVSPGFSPPLPTLSHQGRGTRLLGASVERNPLRARLQFQLSLQNSQEFHKAQLGLNYQVTLRTCEGGLPVLSPSPRGRGNFGESPWPAGHIRAMKRGLPTRHAGLDPGSGSGAGSGVQGFFRARGRWIPAPVQAGGRLCAGMTLRDYRIGFTDH